MSLKEMKPCEFFRFYKWNKSKAIKYVKSLHNALDIGELVSYQNECGNTIVHALAEDNDWEFMSLLNKTDLNNEVFDVPNDFGMTPLDLALRCNHHTPAIQLISKNAVVLDRHIEYALSHNARQLIVPLLEAILKQPQLKPTDIQRCHGQVCAGFRKESVIKDRCVLCSSIDLAISYKNPYALERLLCTHDNVSRRREWKNCGWYSEYPHSDGTKTTRMIQMTHMLANLLANVQPRKRIRSRRSHLVSFENVEMCADMILQHGADMNTYIQTNPESNCSFPARFFSGCGFTLMIAMIISDVVSQEYTLCVYRKYCRAHPSKHNMLESMLAAYERRNLLIFKHLVIDVMRLRMSDVERKTFASQLFVSFIYAIVKREAIDLGYIDVLMTATRVSIYDTSLHRTLTYEAYAHQYGDRHPIVLKHIKTAHTRLTLKKLALLYVQTN